MSSVHYGVAKFARVLSTSSPLSGSQTWFWNRASSVVTAHLNQYFLPELTGIMWLITMGKGRSRPWTLGTLIYEAVNLQRGGRLV